MPAIVIGGDTEAGDKILQRLNQPNREVRAFVTDEQAGARLKEAGIKVAIGDLSDEGHVEAASLHCFSAILIAEAACDDRERSFIDDPLEVTRSWARAVTAAGVTRAIWVSQDEPELTGTPESAWVEPRHNDLVEAVVRLDDAQSIE